MEQAQTPPTPQPTEQPPQPSSIPPPSSTISSSPNPNPTPTPNPNQNPNPNPNPNPKPLTSLQSHHQQQQQQAHQQHQSLHTSQTRPPFNRTWQPQSSHFSHFSSHPHSLPSSSSSLPSTSGSSAPSLSSSASSSVSVPLGQRGGIAIGVPAAHHPSPTPPQSAPFSPSFAQQFGGLGRNAVTMPDSVANSNTSQMRQPTQGYQSMGVMGSLGSGSQMRAGGVPAHHQQRPVQQSLRPQSTPINQSTGTQNFQGHSLLRVPSAGSPGSPSPNTSQSMQSHNQPWLSSGSQGKPPLPSPSFRPPMNPQSLQQRSHIPQQHQHPLPTASQQQQMSSAQQPQQPLPSHQQQEHYGQQFPPLRVPQSLSHQQQITRVQGSGNQKPSSPAMAPPSAVQSGPQNRTASLDTGESGNRILSKRSIHELVNQIDPFERLDPEVEDILVDIADEFVDSITTFGCSLAKHRKSTTLEAKDILLHLERNWNMALPGFSGDEIKIYKKPIANDIHRERLAAIKKSIAGTEAANTRSSAGQAGGSARGHLAKAPTNAMDSPNPKTREVS